MEAPYVIFILKRRHRKEMNVSYFISNEYDEKHTKFQAQDDFHKIISQLA